MLFYIFDITFKNPSFLGKYLLKGGHTLPFVIYKYGNTKEECPSPKILVGRWDCRVTTFLAMTEGWIPIFMGMTCEEAGMTEGGKGGQRGDNKGVCYTSYWKERKY